MITLYDKYKNPDPRCDYPFEPCGAGYCWSFANHVDGHPKFKDMEKICPGCECWMVQDAKKEGEDTHQ